MTRVLVLTALFLSIAVSVEAAAAADPEARPLFQSQNTLSVRIEAPLTTLMRKRSDTEYLDGTLSYTDASGAERILDLKLRARGRYRKQQNICDLPPIRLNFRKKQVIGTEFAGQDKLKLVTHCQNGTEAYEQYVLKEYLAYRIFNIMSDLSFRARLLRVIYVNRERGDETDTRYAFLIEDDELLAERIGARVLEVPYTRYSQLDAPHATLVAVFEYLIGNTDFSTVRGASDDACCHNTVLFSKGSSGLLAIPYDFDFSGLVNARYASPNPKLPVRRVTQRLYRGSCEHNDELEAVLVRFRDKKPAIMEAVASLEGLSERSREQASEFLTGFYGNISDAKSVERHLVRKCLGRD